jgi:hypothetical protein
MNQLVLGQIQGFLLALESISDSGPNEYVEFRFEHVPRTGALASSLTRHTQSLVRRSGRDWRGKPALSEVANWQGQLPARLNEMFFFLRRPSNQSTVDSFMELLARLFEGGDVKVWKLDWHTREGRSTYPWYVAHPMDFVFEHGGEIFQLTLIYSD